MKSLVIYVHGKGGNADEANHYKPLFPNCNVVGFDYKSETPWDAKKEFSADFDSVSSGYDDVMEGGEHWFHTDEQMDFLDRWIKKCQNKQ